MKVIEKRIIDSIFAGKEYNRKRDNYRVRSIPNHSEYYYVELYSSTIAVGKWGSLPFAFSYAGWDTVTTTSRLHSLGVDVYHRKTNLYHRSSDGGVVSNIHYLGWYNVHTGHLIIHLNHVPYLDLPTIIELGDISAMTTNELTRLIKSNKKFLDDFIAKSNEQNEGIIAENKRLRKMIADWSLKGSRLMKANKILLDTVKKNNDMISILDAVCYKLGIEFNAEPVDVKKLEEDIIDSIL